MKSISDDLAGAPGLNWCLVADGLWLFRTSRSGKAVYLCVWENH